MIFGSVCSGIEAASAAWNPLGWRAAFFSEIDPFASAVLAHHHPDVPNLGDMTKFKEWPDADIDVLTGGTPCQSFSNAGLRAGLDDPRGQLMLTFGAIAARYRPTWLVWENVPGVLSSAEGRDFASFLGMLSGQSIEPPEGGWKSAGIVVGIPDAYSLAWRVLDAQYCRVDGYGRAVPQRRNRVFVVGHSGDWRRAAAVLFEREGLRGDPAPRRRPGASVAATLTRGAESSGRGGYAGRRQEDDVNIVAGALAGVGPGSGWRLGADEAAANHCVAHTLRATGFDASEDGTGRGVPLVAQPFQVGNCLTARMAKGINTTVDEGRTPVLAHAPAIAFDARQSDVIQYGEKTGPLDTDGHTIGIAYSTKLHNTKSNQSGKAYEGYTAALDRNSPPPALLTATAVRRLMPVECERLMGFPDGHTATTWRGKPAADGPRYKALGNSWAVNCARWIGRRIEAVEGIKP